MSNPARGLRSWQRQKRLEIKEELGLVSLSYRTKNNKKRCYTLLQLYLLRTKCRFKRSGLFYPPIKGGVNVVN
jgi:hypothetical protein